MLEKEFFLRRVLEAAYASEMAPKRDLLMDFFFFFMFLGLNPHNFSKTYSCCKCKDSYNVKFYGYGTLREKLFDPETVKNWVWGLITSFGQLET